MAADGYYDAGFDVVGWDVRFQPSYPFQFHRGSALDALEDRAYLREFDLIHASPPCQAHTRAKHLREAQGGKSKYDDLLTPTLELLRDCGVPWVVENVVGAPGMEGAVIECGSAYGLKVRRHRLFLASFPLVGSGCKHKEQGKPVGVYHTMGDTCKGVCKKTGKLVIGGSTAKTVEEGRDAMGVTRQITWNELKEGFPPAYTRHVGEQAMAYLLQRGPTSGSRVRLPNVPHVREERNPQGVDRRCAGQPACERGLLQRMHWDAGRGNPVAPQETAHPGRGSAVRHGKP
jgi:DNA (cytosine-5)-methyltransferase 1